MYLPTLTAGQTTPAQSSQKPEYTPEQREAFRKAMDERLRKDWAYLKKYEKSNAEISGSGKKTRAVFIGDSITEFWSKYDSAFWKDNEFINRGISAQTSSQMLVRFRPDVINLHPQVVLINAGTNDIAENTGPISIEAIFGNIVSMAEIAKANNIQVIVSSVLPAQDFSWKPGMEPAEKIMELNKMIREYAEKNQLKYVDYWSALKDDANGLQSKYTPDGVHPNLEGYKTMEPLALAALTESLNVKRSTKNKK